MIDEFRTLSARLVTRWLRGPRGLVIRVRAWLCADGDDLHKKQRCLEAMLELEPDLGWARTALLNMWR